MDKNKKSSSGLVCASRFISPEKLIDELDFQNGMTVANFGCGTGFFAVPIARKIAPDGLIYALDVRQEKLEVIESQSKIFGITNIIARRVNLEEEKGSGLSGECSDWVVIANMLFQNSRKNAVFLEAWRVLKRNGKILLVEWNEEKQVIGPDGKKKIPKDEMEKIVQKNKLKVIKEIRPGDFHYGFILEKQKQ